MEQDTYLAETARAMIAAAARSQSAANVLQKQCPHIYRQIRRLRDCRPLLDLWGRSCNIDEIVRQPIIHPAILQVLGQLSDIPMRGRIVHAGLQHTYGYLFSLIETPFGYKRDRWTQATIEEGFGIELPTLRAQPTAGTLLTNLTWFAGQIAFRDRPRELGILQQMSDRVSPLARCYPYSSLNFVRVVEEASIVNAGGRGRSVQLRTDLIPFPHPPAETGSDNHLLIYSVANERAAAIRLITVFPVTQSVVDDLIAPRNQGEVVVESLPYNAYVRGLNGRTFSARRHVEWADQGR